MNQDQWVRKALDLLNQGKLGPAKAICSKILSQSADHHQANALMGAIHISLQQPKQAIPFLNQAYATARSPHERSQTLNNLGLANTHLADYPAALEALDACLAEVQDNALFYCNRANVYELIKNWSAMASDCSKALSLAPHQTEARVGLAVALRHQNQTEAALEILNHQPNFENNDWLNEWTLNALNLHMTSLVLEKLGSIGTDSAILDIADYIAEEGFSLQTEPLYQFVLTRSPDHPRAQYLNNALTGQTCANAPSEYIEAIFDEHAEAFEKRLTQTLHYDLHKRFASHWSQHIKKTVTHWLDAGCGTGLVGMALKPQYPNAHLIGIDLAKAMLSKAEEKHCYDELIAGNLMDYRPDKPFDLITAMDVMIYLGDYEPVLDLWDTLLSPRGIIAFSIEVNERSDQSVELQTNGRFAHNPHKVQLTLEQRGYALLLTESFPLRKEAGLDVKGQLFIAQWQRS